MSTIIRLNIGLAGILIAIALLDVHAAVRLTALVGAGFLTVLLVAPRLVGVKFLSLVLAAVPPKILGLLFINTTSWRPFQ